MWKKEYSRMDWWARQLNGINFTVRYVDSPGQILLKETGIALIPGADQYSVIGR